MAEIARSITTLQVTAHTNNQQLNEPNLWTIIYQQNTLLATSNASWSNISQTYIAFFFPSLSIRPPCMKIICSTTSGSHIYSSKVGHHFIRHFMLFQTGISLGIFSELSGGKLGSWFTIIQPRDLGWVQVMILEKHPGLLYCQSTCAYVATL